MNNTAPTPPEMPSEEDQTPPLVTLRQALGLIETWTDLSPARRRDLASSLRAVQRMCLRYEQQHASEVSTGPTTATGSKT